MEYDEYMASLTEQIHDKRAKQLVAKEIRNHIEEQAESYEMDGIDHAEAIKEAIRQMGNPVETGIELNKIHKPKMPWVMLALVSVIMLTSIIMQAIIFAEGASNHGNWGNLLASTLVYNGMGFATILLLLYMDYNFIAKHAYKFYTVFMMGLPAGLILADAVTSAMAMATAYYGFQMIFPVIFAGVIYRNRNFGWKGVGICLLFGLFGIVWYGVVYEVLGRTSSYSYYPAQAESLIIIGLMIAFAIWKGIFGKDGRKQRLLLLMAVGILLIMGIIILGMSDGMREYLWRRILNIFVGTENGYMNVLLQNSISQASWMGGQSFLLGTPNTETYTTFALNSVFTYFGKIAGIAVIAMCVLFIIMALRMSLKQSNRIGFLIGTACTVSILVRFVAYVAINMGCGLWWTTLVPFLSYGKVSAVMNGIYIGLILCVYRNGNILQEEGIPQKRLPKIVEKFQNRN